MTEIPLSPLVENTTVKVVIFLSGEKQQTALLAWGIRKAFESDCELANEFVQKVYWSCNNRNYHILR